MHYILTTSAETRRFEDAEYRLGIEDGALFVRKRQPKTCIDGDNDLTELVFGAGAWQRLEVIR